MSSASLNRVFLVGNLTRDPEVREIPSGQQVCNLGLAVNETYRNRDGELVESTCFADVAVWGRSAETCRQYLVKGSQVLVDGKLQFERWETPDGEKRSRLRVRATRVQFLARTRGEEASTETAAAAPAAAGSDTDDALPF